MDLDLLDEQLDTPSQSGRPSPDDGISTSSRFQRGGMTYGLDFKFSEHGRLPDDTGPVCWPDDSLHRLESLAGHLNHFRFD